MTKPAICVNPVTSYGTPMGELLCDPTTLERVNEVRPYILEFEITNRCAGSCKYCLSSSTDVKDTSLPREKILEILEDSWEIGIRQMDWTGGDIFTHPDWYDMAQYAAQKGFRNQIQASGLISRRDAKRLYNLRESICSVTVHIDTLVQEDYNELHDNPATLAHKIQGYRNLLETGFPPEKTAGIITFSRPAARSIEQTIDWYVDQMGAPAICFTQFMTTGFGVKNRHLEPSLAEVKRAMEYRAQKLGSHWLRIGASDIGMFFCRTAISIKCYGDVTPCQCLDDLAVGSVYRKRLTQIFEENRDALLFNDRVKGFCGESCENRDVCFGCRARAYHYTGDVMASDPKCWLNPAAKEHYFREA